MRLFYSRCFASVLDVHRKDCALEGLIYYHRAYTQAENQQLNMHLAALKYTGLSFMTKIHPLQSIVGVRRLSASFDFFLEFANSTFL